VEGRILLIDYHPNNRKLLRQQFELEGLEVIETTTGEEGLQTAIRTMPQAILLNAMLPDMLGVDVATRLREIARTKHIYLMMLGGEDDHQQRLTGLDAGANDFINSPIDPELVALRVRNALNRRSKDNTIDPTTGMPAGRHVQDELLNLLRQPEGDWALVRFRVRKVDPLREVHGFVAGDNLVHGVARILAEVLANDDIEDDFLGYGGQDDFVIITKQTRVASLIAEAQEKFAAEVGTYYDEADCERGYVESDGQQFPFATLRARSVTPADGPFYDIRSLSEALAG